MGMRCTRCRQLNEEGQNTVFVTHLIHKYGVMAVTGNAVQNLRAGTVRSSCLAVQEYVGLLGRLWLGTQYKLQHTVCQH